MTVLEGPENVVAVRVYDPLGNVGQVAKKKARRANSNSSGDAKCDSVHQLR